MLSGCQDSLGKMKRKKDIKEKKRIKGKVPKAWSTNMKAGRAHSEEMQKKKVRKEAKERNTTKIVEFGQLDPK